MGTNEFQIVQINGENFKQIFQNYYQPLYHLGLNYLEDEAEAKEVVQDIVLKFIEYAHNSGISNATENHLWFRFLNRQLMPIRYWIIIQVINNKLKRLSKK